MSSSPPRKKVLITVDTLGIGGAERQLMLLVKNLPRCWLPMVWSLDDGYFQKRLREWNIPVIINPRNHRIDISPFLSLRKIIQEWKPQIVHSWGWMGAFASAPICKLARIPHLNGIIRNASMPLDNRLSILLSKISFFLSDIIISNTYAGLDAWRVKPSKGRVIYNGFDTSRLTGTVGNLKIEPNKFLVIMAARLNPAKDFFTFLEAAHKVSEIDDEIVFWIIGSGQDKERLMEQAASLVSSGRMAFINGGDELIPWIRMASVGVLMSNRLEGCSNTIMEYMACGLPVICSDGGGNRELVLENETGLIIPPKDSNALVKKILFLKQNPELLRRMGSAGRERIMDNFSVRIMVTETLMLYEAAMKNKRGFL